MKTRFAAASGQEMDHGRKEVKFGDAGDAILLFSEVPDVTKVPVAVRHIIEHHRDGERGTLRGRELHLERDRRQDSHEEERRGRHVINSEIHVDSNEA